VAGDPAEAERSMEATITELEEMGSEVGGVHWGIRALALYRLDRFDEARAAAQQVSVQFSDLSSVCLALGVEAMVLAREGALEDAELIARDAVARMDASDFPNDRADMRMSLAEVLEIAGRPGEAIDAIHEAIALYEAKGNVQQARTARARLESLTG